MTSAGRPGLGSSSKESRPRLNSTDHFATVEYFGLLSPYTSAMRRWISLAFAPSLVRNLWLLWTQYSDFPFLPMGIDFQTKSKSKNVRVDWTAVIIQLTKVYTAQKWKKKSWIVQENSEFYELIALPSYLGSTFVIHIAARMQFNFGLRCSLACEDVPFSLRLHCSPGCEGTMLSWSLLFARLQGYAIQNWSSSLLVRLRGYAIWSRPSLFAKQRECHLVSASVIHHAVRMPFNLGLRFSPACEDMSFSLGLRCSPGCEDMLFNFIGHSSYVNLSVDFTMGRAISDCNQNQNYVKMAISIKLGKSTRPHLHLRCIIHPSLWNHPV